MIQSSFQDFGEAVVLSVNHNPFDLCVSQVVSCSLTSLPCTQREWSDTSRGSDLKVKPRQTHMLGGEMLFCSIFKYKTF